MRAHLKSTLSDIGLGVLIALGVLATLQVCGLFMDENVAATVLLMFLGAVSGLRLLWERRQRKASEHRDRKGTETGS